MIISPKVKETYSKITITMYAWRPLRIFFFVPEIEA